MNPPLARIWGSPYLWARGGFIGPPPPPVMRVLPSYDLIDAGIEGMRLVSISVDGAHDTPDQLATAAHF